VLIGVNDPYRGGDAETWHPRFRAMLARAMAPGGRRSPARLRPLHPGLGVSPFARQSRRDAARIAVAIDRFNAVGR
jgi:hypothetical protein